MTTKNGPIERLQDRHLGASIFANEGQNGRFYNVSLDRVYTDPTTGEAKRTHILGQNDLLAGGRLLERAYTRTVELRKADRAAELKKGRQKPKEKDTGEGVEP